MIMQSVACKALSAVVLAHSAHCSVHSAHSAASWLQENEKPNRLEAELELVDEKRAIVFVNTKNKCDMVSRQLDMLGHRCTVLHGGKTQVQGPLCARMSRDMGALTGASCAVAGARPHAAGVHPSAWQIAAQRVRLWPEQLCGGLAGPA